MQALIVVLDTVFQLAVDYSHHNMVLCDTINWLNDQVVAGLKLIDPKATFMTAEVTEVVTMTDNLYQRDLDKFDKIKAKLDHVRL